MVYFTVNIMRALQFTRARTLTAVGLFLTVMLTWRESLLPPPSPQLNPMISRFGASFRSTSSSLYSSSPPTLFWAFYACVPPPFLFPHVRQLQSAVRPHTGRLMLKNTYGHSLPHSQARTHMHIQYTWPKLLQLAFIKKRKHKKKSKKKMKSYICFHKSTHGDDNTTQLDQYDVES